VFGRRNSGITLNSYTKKFKQIVKIFINRAVYASAGYIELKSFIIANTDLLIDFSRPPLNESDNRISNVLKLVLPMSLRGLREVRIGGNNDGGYIMREFLPSEIDGALSIGIGSDVSWDLHVSSLGISVDMFDPTIKKLPRKVPGGRFHRVGIGPLDSKGSKYVSISKLRENAGLNTATNIILKLDVEGAEWAALRNLPDHELERYSQIVIEMHHLSRIVENDFYQSVIEVLTSLNSGHIPIHLHANNYSPLTKFGHYSFPDTIEVTYVRRSENLEIIEKEVVASPLDRPNCPDLIDYCLDGILAL
jgi:hypothetical protein